MIDKGDPIERKPIIIGLGSGRVDVEGQRIMTHYNKSTRLSSLSPSPPFPFSVFKQVAIVLDPPQIRSLVFPMPSQ
jgi:hypothetical protein